MTSIQQRASVAIGSSLWLTAIFSCMLTLAPTGHAMAMDISKDQAESALVGPIYELGGKLMAALSKNDGQANIIMSPISIHQALSMVLLGSDDESLTKREILDSIGYSNMSKAEIEHCNKAYARLMSEYAKITGDTLASRNEFARNNNTDEYQKSQGQPRSPIIDLFAMMVTKNRGEAKPNYANDIEKYFHASISSIDDGQPQTKADLIKRMNDWAKEAGFENPIMSEDYLRGEFEAILISAIRLEAFWYEQFVEGHDDKIFYNYGSKEQPVGGKYLYSRNLDGSKYLEFTSSERAEVKYLHELMSKDETFVNLSKLNFRAIAIPLIEDLSFVIIEPLESSSSEKPNSNLNRLVEELAANIGTQSGPGSRDERPMTKLAKTLELLDHPETSGHVDYLKMPKFKFESDIDLKSALKSIGLRRGFDDNRAEISNITMNKLYIDDIKHKAVIETTTTGIKAAGVTMVKFMLLSAMVGPKRVEVEIENPFMFIVRHQKTPLFVGQLTNL